jgi:hypothetical protein
MTVAASKGAPWRPSSAARPLLRTKACHPQKTSNPIRAQHLRQPTLLTIPRRPSAEPHPTSSTIILALESR